MASPDKQHKILIVDDNARMRQMLAATFTRDAGFEVTAAANGEKAIDRLHHDAFDIIITDLSMPGKDGMAVLRAAKEVSPEIEVIIITAYGTIETAVEAMRLGARDFIAKPFKIAELELKVDKILQARQRATRTWVHPAVRHMVGDSEHTKRILTMVEKVGPSRSSVLITGPSGTGKELVARAVHDASPRRDQPFVAVNCAALAPGVLESELFGHEKGAFTGADSRRIGRFEMADKTTLFLDEVAELDPGLQAKLLRVLESGEFERVGGTHTLRVDVRVVAATNRDPTEAIRKGQLREDLYYRLKVFEFKLEPLRGRRDDIPALVDHFVRRFSLETGKEVRGVDDTVMEVFMRYPWPGNVRELENMLERAVVLATGPVVTTDELPHELFLAQDDLAPVEPGTDGPLAERTDQLESAMIADALERFHWNKTKAAEHLGLKRTTLQYKIKKYQLE